MFLRHALEQARRLPSLVDQAAADGFTHVETFGGPVPLEQFHLRDALGMTYADGVIYSPWRNATTAEEVAWEAAGHAPMICLKARDKWACAKAGA